MQTDKENSSSKKLIFSADDFGKCEEMDYAILKGFENGILTSTCIMANGDNYDHAVNEIYPQCSQIGMGCHLNIIEGKSLLNKTSTSRLCDISGNYNKGYLQMLANSSDKKFLAEVEAEFRVQIEKILSDFSNEQIDHINSHVHTHSIPAIFEITAKLAQEYGIPSIRTQCEVPYFVPNVSKYVNMGILDTGLNIVKNTLLNMFTPQNKDTARKYNLKTNDFFIGLLFTGHMDKITVLNGLKAVKKENSVTEVLVHPYLYSSNTKIDLCKQIEYLLTQDETLNSEIVKIGYDFSKFSNIS